MDKSKDRGIKQATATALLLRLFIGFIFSQSFCFALLCFQHPFNENVRMSFHLDI